MLMIDHTGKKKEFYGAALILNTVDSCDGDSTIDQSTTCDRFIVNRTWKV